MNKKSPQQYLIQKTGTSHEGKGKVKSQSDIKIPGNDGEN